MALRQAGSLIGDGRLILGHDLQRMSLHPL